MTTDTKYGGWTNYETWAVKLWLNNDQGWQEQCNEWAIEYLQEAIDREQDKSHAVDELADRLKWLHEETAPAADGVFSDLLNHALASVNWEEIAQSCVNEVEVYSAGWNAPGCMPDNEPAMFLDTDDAKRCILDAIRNHAEEAGNEADAETLTAFAEDINLEKGEFSAQCLGIAYWVHRS
jgi:hypothetical protein